jgi:hypothetical protein
MLLTRSRALQLLLLLALAPVLLSETTLIVLPSRREAPAELEMAFVQYSVAAFGTRVPPPRLQRQHQVDHNTGRLPLAGRNAWIQVR